MRKVEREAEEAVLGAILLSDKVLPVLVTDEGLRADHFGSPQLRTVFEAANGLAERDEPVDEMTLVAELTRRGLLAQAGGEAMVVSLAGAVPNLANVRAYARRVVAVAKWRRTAEAGQLLVQAAEQESENLIEQAERLIAPEEKNVIGGSVASRAFDYLSKPGHAGAPWPFRKLNELANGGMMKGETTILAAVSSTGKTALLDQILGNVCDKGFTARLYINEAKDVFRALRYVARVTGIPYANLRGRTLSPEQAKQAASVLSKGLPFEIVPCHGWTADEIARDIRWHPADVTALDLLHEVNFSDERELASNWTKLKAAAVDTHFIATAHLNETRSVSDKPPSPVLRDLRGSGMLKNGSDFVLFAHREHEIIDGHAEMQLPGAIWFAKTREGALGGLRVLFDPVRIRFVVEDRFS
jgi:replicative DNA helicase